MSERVVVVGATRPGMSAASQAKRVEGDDLEVVALERGTHTSYSACGIPYWVGGDVDSRRRRSSPGRRSSTGPTASTSGCGPRRWRSTWTGARWRCATTRAASTYRLGFDHLVLATGARPRRPDVPGVDAEGIYGVQTLDDGERLLESLERVAAPGGRRRRWLHRHRDGRGDVPPRPRGHRADPVGRADGHARPGHGQPGAPRDGGDRASTCAPRSGWTASRSAPTGG